MTGPTATDRALRWLCQAALVLPLCLAGCGGNDGADGASPAAAAATVETAAAAAAVSAAASSPAATVTQLRAKALAIAEGGVAPEEAARQLMDFAEASFAVYFPSHPATQSFAPFVFRFYPETGIYLGVVVSAGMGYSEAGVYVMGGAFGQTPQFVGPLSAFITVRPAPLAIVIDKTWMFFAATGQQVRLTAQAQDANGALSAINVTWTSSAPDKVAVDGAGMLTAKEIGSAQIVAESGGRRSTPTLVVVATPQPGALLVSDAQVLAVGPPLRLGAGATPGLGTEYEVTLQGVATPLPGSVVLATESAPVAGKVVATRQDAAGLVVTLALAPLQQLLSAYDIRWAIDLSAFALEAVPLRSATAALWTRPLEAGSPGTASPRRRALAQRQDVVAPFKALECSGSINPDLIDAKIQLEPEVKLKLVIENTPGHAKQALEGTASLGGSVTLTLQAGFSASGKCEAARQFAIPAFGWLSLIVMPAVRFGVGVKLNGELRLVQGELGVEGKLGFNTVMGWECGGATPACRGLDDITPFNEFKTKSKIPSKNDMQVKVDAQFYALAGLDLSLFAGLGNAKIIEARTGPKQSFDLGFEEDQAARSDYASSYDLKLETVIEPGAALQKAIEKVIGDDHTGVKFKASFALDLAESPKGGLSVNKARVPIGAAVDFTVVLDPKTTDYTLLGYNVTGVELYRRAEGEIDFKAWKSMPFSASNQTTFNYHWITVAADVGKYEFAALVNTQLLTPLLEVAPDSVQSVEVSCFSTNAMATATSATTSAATSATASATTAATTAATSRPRQRARAQAAAPGARQGSPAAANTCVDAWSGSATFIGKTPGLATANISTRATITWTLDPASSGPFGTYYSATGGSFDLALNSPDGCTFALSPRIFAIAFDPLTPGRLAIFNNPLLGPPSYAFGGQQLVNTTVTASCPGKADVVSQLNGFLVTYASGSGPFTAGQSTLTGSIEDAATSATWNFTHP